VICSVAGCPREAHSRGWCPGHYARWRRYGVADVSPRPIGSGGRLGREQDRLGAEPLVRAVERYLEHRDMTRQDFARDVGVSEKALRHWGCGFWDRRGRLHPSPCEVPALPWFTADRIITYMDMLWWDVYDDERWPEEHARAAVLLGGERESVVA
jgi:hypothetical protein